MSLKLLSSPQNSKEWSAGACSFDGSRASRLLPVTSSFSFSLFTGSLLSNISAVSSNVKDPPVSRRSSASRKSDSAISSFWYIFSSAGRAFQISSSSASSGSVWYSSSINFGLRETVSDRRLADLLPGTPDNV